MLVKQCSVLPGLILKMELLCLNRVENYLGLQQTKTFSAANVLLGS